MQIRTLLLALLVSIALPALASAQNLDDASRVSIFTGGGFGGSVNLNLHSDSGDADLGSADLAATPLVGARFESSLMRYVLLGGQYRASFYRAKDGDNRNSLHDFDITAKGRFPIHMKSFVLEPYVLLPFGFTLSVLNKDNVSGGASRANPGWNIGGLAGATFLTQSGWGAFFELGVMHHAFYDKETVTIGGSDISARLSATLTQFTMHVGGTYAF